MKFILSIAIASLLCITNINTIAAQAADTTVTIKVKGVSCANDSKIIETNVEKLEGVVKCDAGKKGAVTSFIITYSPNTITEKELQSAIEGTGSCSNPNARPYKVKP